MIPFLLMFFGGTCAFYVFPRLTGCLALLFVVPVFSAGIGFATWFLWLMANGFEASLTSFLVCVGAIGLPLGTILGVSLFL